MDPKDKDTEASTPLFKVSQSANSASISFLDLPNETRNKIYQMVLIILHPLYLFQDPGSPVDAFAPDRPPQWLALLHTNRQISAEASTVLYRVNHFELVDITMRQTGVLQSFLDCIGAANAASISHVCINFPIVVSMDEEPGKLRLREDSLRSLNLLQNKCTNLSTLETVVHFENSDFFMKTDQFLREALSEVEAQLKAIPSLQRIIVRVEVQSGFPTSSTKDMMKRLGWLVLDGQRT